MLLHATIPEEVWTTIFIFLTYDDLLSVWALSNRFRRLVRENTTQVEVTRSSQLRVLIARRFPNLQSITVSCFVSCPPSISDEHVQDDENSCRCGATQILNFDAADRLPFFLCQFPKLQKVRLCGTYTCTCLGINFASPFVVFYDPDTCVADGHEERMRGFLRSLAGAFSSGALATTIQHFQGLRCPVASEALFFVDRSSADGVGSHPPSNHGAGCNECRLLLRSVPPHVHVETPASFGGWQRSANLIPDWTTCLSERTIFCHQLEHNRSTVDPEEWAFNLLSCVDITQTWYPVGVGYHPEVLEALSAIKAVFSLDKDRMRRSVRHRMVCLNSEDRRDRSEDPAYRLSQPCREKLIKMGILSAREEVSPMN